MNQESITIADLMTTALITLKPGDTVGSADVEMKFAAIRHIPIVDERNRLVGMLSNRDILRALGTSKDKKVVVGEIMAKGLHTANIDTPAHEVSEMILKHKIGAIPVLGDEQQLVGLVTETDFVRYAHELLGGEPWV